MPNKSIPTLGDSNWGTPLNNHLSQLHNPSTGGINSFDTFLGRPLASTLTVDDTGKTYLYTQTGNLHQWNGNAWKVLNESVINIKDYGAVGNAVVAENASTGVTTNISGTDDTAAIKTAIALAKSLVKPLYIPVGKFLVSSTLEVYGIEVFGDDKYNCIIQATFGEFDIFTTTGETRFRNFAIYGGWDRTTAGQKGNSILLNNSVPVTNVPLTAKVFIENMVILNSKENAIRLNTPAYSHISGVYSLYSGSNGLYIWGESLNNSATTVEVNSCSTFSLCPNGFGVKIEAGTTISLNSIVSEYTKGFYLGDIQNINMVGCHQEHTIGLKFITWGGSGQGLNIISCYGGGCTLDYSKNYYGVNFLGNMQIYMTNTLFPNEVYLGTWGMVQEIVGANNTLITRGHKEIFGLNTINSSGGTPAHILDTSLLNSNDKSILELRNAGAVKMRVDASGNVYTDRLVFRDYVIFVNPTSGNLLIKNGFPTSENDGTVLLSTKSIKELGLNAKNASGNPTVPAHILDSAPLAGEDKSLLDIRNNGVSSMRVDALGGIYTPRLHLGNYTLFVNPSTGKLLIKNGSPANENDGDVVGLQT